MFSRLLCLFSLVVVINGLHKYSPPRLDTSQGSSGIERFQAKLRPLNILIVTAFFPGHLFPLVSLGETLVKRGHNVSLCTTVMAGSKLLPGLAERVGLKFVKAGDDNLSQHAYEALIREFHVTSLDSELVYRYMQTIQPTVIQVRDQVEAIGVSQFDLIISDMNTLPIAVYFSKLGIKTIVFSSYLPPVPALIPQWPSPMAPLDQVDNLSFFERLLNAVIQPILVFGFRHTFEGVCSVDKNFSYILGDHNLVVYPGIRLPLIVTSAMGFEFPKTINPMTHFVGPVLMSSSPELDPKLLTWLNVRKNRSVIYISMGTTGFITADMARSIVLGVMATKYDAVWALRMSNRDILNGVDIDKDRFYLAEWIPQQTILKHSAIVLTILHCGMNGVQESLYNALPIVCLPYSFDHYEMSARIQSAGVGVSIYSFYQSLIFGKSFTPQKMTNAIRSVDTAYAREQAQKIQLLYYFAGGSQRAAELVEFYELVGYAHLIPAYVKYNWTWVQYYNVDVYCALLVLSVVLVYVLYQLVKFMARCFEIDYKSKLE